MKQKLYQRYPSVEDGSKSSKCIVLDGSHYPHHKLLLRTHKQHNRL